MIKTLIILLTMCSGCSTMDGGLKETIQYQILRQVVKQGRRQLKTQLQAGISYDEYERRYQAIRIGKPKGNLIELNGITITKKGKLRIKKQTEELNEDINKVFGFKKEKVHLGLSFSLDRLTATIDYGRFELRFKQYYDGDWKFLFEYEIKF